MPARLSESEIRQRLRSVFINPATVADHPLAAAPGAGLKTVCYGFHISAHAGANDCQFKSGAVGIFPILSLADNQMMPYPPEAFVPLFETAENAALNVSLSAATAVGVTVWILTERV